MRCDIVSSSGLKGCMARKNRVSISDAVYHLTARVVNRACLFSDPSFKDWIVDGIYGAADFSGVDVLAWCVMDNHLHLFVHVPEVPVRYRTGNDAPDSYAFGMRPVECNVPLWSPLPASPSAVPGASSGDSPRENGIGNGVVAYTPSRPPVGFMLDDDEMADRLLSLYGNAKRVAAIRRRWDSLRADNRGREVELEKEGYCRRMYNVSQFMKTLKERIAERYNLKYKRTGQLWDGRFYSGVVERSVNVMGIVASYIECNPLRAGLVKDPAAYRWNSLGQAFGTGKYAARCRQGYERLFGCDWSKALELLRRIIHARIEKGTGGAIRPRASQAIKTRIRVLSHGAFIGIDHAFGMLVLAALPHRYPAAKPERDIAECRRFDWGIPPPSAAA